jgi:hypothetical protein
MTRGPSDDLPPSWLAAYADGELSPADRDRVERWLADDPEARELLDAQESFGPRNTELWNAVQPPAPSGAEWTNTFDRIAPRATPPRRAWTGWLGTIGLVATAATLVIAIPDPKHQCLNPPLHNLPYSPPASPAEEEPFVLASADDVRIISMPESAAGLLLVGEHPLGDSLLVLAEFGEIAFFGVGADLAGRFPAVPDDPNVQDAPMLWAPR